MNKSVKIIAIILAAGRGTRAGGSVPKQWQTLMGKPLISWAIEPFLTHPLVSEVVVLHHVDDIDLLAKLPSEIRCFVGGSNRSESVRCGLSAIEPLAPDYVLVHDAARPCLDQSLLSDCIDAMMTQRAAAPAVSVQDTLWRGKDLVLDVIDRTEVLRAQTPQCFDYKIIHSAHMGTKVMATDDVQVVRAAGHAVAIVTGNEDNIKVTLPRDFVRAERILRGRMKIRVGNGFDVHRFGTGSELTLCGVTIPHKMGLVGHSDADVGMHAVTDAIYGALARGDIGQHFPPSDPKWRGVASEVFLKHAVKLAANMGFRIENIDCTLICEFPKVGPHAEQMRVQMAHIMGLEGNQISIKATTSETLGFTGREEGIAAIASAALVSL
tara:strand:- start:3126 stop:4268 length:1143 start_codon:yes stop_codon:yes gene_type:complete